MQPLRSIRPEHCGTFHTQFWLRLRMFNLMTISHIPIGDGFTPCGILRHIWSFNYQFGWFWCFIWGSHLKPSSCFSLIPVRWHSNPKNKTACIPSLVVKLLGLPCVDTQDMAQTHGNCRSLQDTVAIDEAFLGRDLERSRWQHRELDITPPEI